MESERTHVLAASEVKAVEVIDSGDTLAVQLCASDGGEICVLLPMGAVGNLLSQLADALDVGFDRTSRPLG